MKKILIILLFNLFINPVSNKTNPDIHLCTDIHHLNCDSFCECDGFNCNLSLTKF